MYTFLLTEQIHNNNKIKRTKAKDTTLKHVLVFPFIKNKASWILAEKIEQKNLNEWKKQQQTKKILNGCTPCLFTLRQEDQPFDKALPGQNN